MKIKDILIQKNDNVFSIKQDQPVYDAIIMFSDKGIGSLIVTDNSDKIAGIITEKDIIKCYRHGKKPEELKVEELMTSAEKLIVCTEDDKVQYAMSMMTEHRIKHIPVLYKEKVIGLISIGDVIKAQLEESKQITKRLEDYISGAYPAE